MSETILITSALNGTELLRSMALRGRDTFAFRVMHPAELAAEALIRCGMLPGEKQVRSDEQQVVIARLMKDVPYFSDAFSLQDAMNLTSTLNDMRMRFAAEESRGLHQTLSQGEFADKNAALLVVYDRYISWLDENDRMDEIGLIRFAVEQAREMNSEFLIPDEFLLTPLENALVKRLSGGKFRKVSLQELYGVPSRDSSENPASSLRLDSLTEVYGPVNEVDQVIKDIYDSGAALDRCVVAVTDPGVYGQLFYDLAMEKGVPVSFGCGIPISNTGPAGLLSLWDHWHGVGFHGVDALQVMVYSDTFNRSALMDILNQERNEEEGQVPLRRLTALAGGLRLEPDAMTNERRISAWENTLSESSEDLKWARSLRLLGRELSLPCETFLKKYANIRKHPVGGPLDRSALNEILNVLSLANRFPDLVSIKDMIPIALAQSVSADQAQPGKLTVTTIAGAPAIQRDHLYLLGLSADRFPGKPGENALMLDSDWELLPEAETAPTSRNRVENVLNRMMELDRLAASLGTDVHAYWPDYDPAGLKELIPSSVVYLLRDVCPGALQRKAGYFPTAYSEPYAAGKLYLDEKNIFPATEVRELTAKAGINPEEAEWAPTAIDTWFGCKRQFLYKYVLKLEAPEEDDPMQVISPIEVGNLAHHLMEILASERPTENEFRNTAASMFDEYLTARPPMDPDAAEREKERFIRMMADAWRQDPGREAVLSEEELHGVHPCGLRLKGRPDRVEADENGKYIIVDFKTGKTVRQEANNSETCRQALIYAWMLRQNGMEPAHCEYRYLRRSQIIPCETNALTMGKLDEDLRRFYTGLRSGDFAPEDGYGRQHKKEDCRYCPYAGVCKADEAGEEAQA